LLLESKNIGFWIVADASHLLLLRF